MSLNLKKSEWRRVRLGEVVRRSRKQVDPVEQRVQRYVAGGHIDSESITVSRWGDPRDGQMGSTFRYIFRPGQVLFVSARPYLKKMGIVNFSGVVADKTYVLEAVPDKGLLQEFLPFVLSSAAFIQYATAESTGSMNPRLLWGPFQRYEFPLPGLDEQKRIADLLWTIERHKQTLAKMAASMVAMRTLTLELALEVGKQQGWPEKPVPDLVMDGPRNGKSAPSVNDSSGVPTLSISAVREGQIRGGSSVKYMDVAAENVKNFVLERDDFLVVRGNGNKQLTGLGGLVTGGLPDGCVYPDLLIRLRFDRRRILPAFAAAQWNAQAAHQRLLQNAKSTNGIWKINGQDIKSHTLVNPPLVEQQAIVDDLNLLSGAGDAVRDEFGSLDTLRSALLAEIFGGA